MMYRSKHMRDFQVIWWLWASTFPASPDFLCERFIEDIADGEDTLHFVILDCQPPEIDPGDLADDKEVAVKFEITCTEQTAKAIQELGFKVQPVQREGLTLNWDEGLTWEVAVNLIRGHATGPLPQLKWDQEVRATDDVDTDAPWYRVMGLRRDESGYFLALEPMS